MLFWKGKKKKKTLIEDVGTVDDPCRSGGGEDSGWKVPFPGHFRRKKKSSVE